jgi:hypothetical protein
VQTQSLDQYKNASVETSQKVHPTFIPAVRSSYLISTSDSIQESDWLSKVEGSWTARVLVAQYYQLVQPPTIHHPAT